MTKTYTLKELELKPGDKIGWITHPKSVRWIVNNCGNLVGVTSKIPLNSIYYEGGQKENCCKFVLISRAEPEYKTWGEMTDEEKGALLLAHHQGKTIEFLNYNGNWNKCKPAWFNNDSYRIKPEPVVKTVTLFGGSAQRYGDTWAFDYCTGKSTHRITFDVVDGEPDCNSISMEKL